MYDQPTSADVRELLSRAYAAFNARDIDAVLSMMHPDVEWPNAMEGGYVYGPERTIYRIKHGLLQDYLIQQLKNPSVQMVLA